MALIDEINELMKQAMKDKNQTALNALRGIKSALKYKQVESGGEIDDAMTLSVIQKDVKKRKDSIEQFKQGNRPDLVAEEEAQLAVIEKFVPGEMSDAELEEITKAVIAELGASSKKEMGAVMKALMPRLAGRADGKRVNQVVGALLS
ncbi:MAG: GatB/YqeY domain-containing protein [bacterium]